MRVIVTGAAGFIGSAICRELLEKGNEVTGIDNYHSHYSKATKRNNLSDLFSYRGFSFVEGDISDEKKILDIFKRSGCDMVAHFASEVGARRSMTLPGAYYRVNILGTQNVIDASISIGVKKLIMASTSNIYGGNTKTVLSEDEELLNPVTPYAVSKLANEYMGKIVSGQHGIDVAMLRIFSAFGPGQRPDLAIHKFMKLVESGETVKLFSDNNKVRDYVYSGDIARGVAKCIENISGFQIMNIGSGKGISLGEVIKTIEEITGMDAEIKYIEPPPGYIDSGIADISRAEELIGYRPEIEFSTGVGNFYEWYKKYREL